MDKTSLSRRPLLNVAWIAFSFVIIMGCFIDVSNGQARMLDPMGRSSQWRYELGVPTNFEDHLVNCGGLDLEKFEVDAMCGVCGDNLTMIRGRYVRLQNHSYPNAGGGMYAQGKIRGKYNMSDEIIVKVQILASRLGYIEFHLCPNNDFTKSSTIECMKDHPLLPLNGTVEGFKWMVPDKITKALGNHYIRLQLPVGLKCAQCVLRMRWRTGTNWGDEGPIGGLGFGPQEYFFACTDIQIGEGFTQEELRRMYTWPILTTVEPWSYDFYKKKRWYQKENPDNRTTVLYGVPATDRPDFYRGGRVKASTRTLARQRIVTPPQSTNPPRPIVNRGSVNQQGQTGSVASGGRGRDKAATSSPAKQRFVTPPPTANPPRPTVNRGSVNRQGVTSDTKMTYSQSPIRSGGSQPTPVPDVTDRKRGMLYTTRMTNSQRLGGNVGATATLYSMMISRGLVRGETSQPPMTGRMTNTESQVLRTGNAGKVATPMGLTASPPAGMPEYTSPNTILSPQNGNTPMYTNEDKLIPAMDKGSPQGSYTEQIYPSGNGRTNSMYKSTGKPTNIKTNMESTGTRHRFESQTVSYKMTQSTQMIESGRRMRPNELGGNGQTTVPVTPNKESMKGTDTTEITGIRLETGQPPRANISVTQTEPMNSKPHRTSKTTGKVEPGMTNTHAPGNVERGMTNAQAPGIVKPSMTHTHAPGNVQPGMTKIPTSVKKEPGMAYTQATDKIEPGMTYAHATGNVQPGMTYTPAPNSGSLKPVFESGMTKTHAPGNVQPGMTNTHLPGNVQPGMTYTHAPGNVQPGITKIPASGKIKPRMTSIHSPGNEQLGMTYTHAPAHLQPAMTYTPVRSKGSAKPVFEPGMAKTNTLANVTPGMTYTHVPANVQPGMTKIHTPTNEQPGMAYTPAPGGGSAKPVFVWVTSGSGSSYVRRRVRVEGLPSPPTKMSTKMGSFVTPPQSSQLLKNTKGDNRRKTTVVSMTYSRDPNMENTYGSTTGAKEKMSHTYSTQENQPMTYTPHTYSTPEGQPMTYTQAPGISVSNPIFIWVTSGSGMSYMRRRVRVDQLPPDQRPTTDKSTMAAPIASPPRSSSIYFSQITTLPTLSSRTTGRRTATMESTKVSSADLGSNRVTSSANVGKVEIGYPAPGFNEEKVTKHYPKDGTDKQKYVNKTDKYYPREKSLVDGEYGPSTITTKEELGTSTTKNYEIVGGSVYTPAVQPSRGWKPTHSPAFSDGTATTKEGPTGSQTYGTTGYQGMGGTTSFSSNGGDPEKGVDTRGNKPDKDYTSSVSGQSAYPTESVKPGTPYFQVSRSLTTIDQPKTPSQTNAATTTPQTVPSRVPRIGVEQTSPMSYPGTQPGQEITATDTTVIRKRLTDSTQTVPRSGPELKTLRPITQRTQQPTTPTTRPMTMPTAPIGITRPTAMTTASIQRTRPPTMPTASIQRTRPKTMPTSRPRTRPTVMPTVPIQRTRPTAIPTSSIQRTRPTTKPTTSIQRTRPTAMPTASIQRTRPPTMRTSRPRTKPTAMSTASIQRTRPVTMPTTSIRRTRPTTMPTSRPRTRRTTRTTTARTTTRRSTTQTPTATRRRISQRTIRPRQTPKPTRPVTARSSTIRPAQPRTTKRTTDGTFGNGIVTIQRQRSDNIIPVDKEGKEKEYLKNLSKPDLTPIEAYFVCDSTNIYQKIKGMRKWCVSNCIRGFCPQFLCTADCMVLMDTYNMWAYEHSHREKR